MSERTHAYFLFFYFTIIHRYKVASESSVMLDIVITHTLLLQKIVMFTWFQSLHFLTQILTVILLLYTPEVVYY